MSAGNRATERAKLRAALAAHLARAGDGEAQRIADLKGMRANVLISFAAGKGRLASDIETFLTQVLLSPTLPFPDIAGQDRTQMDDTATTADTKLQEITKFDVNVQDIAVRVLNLGVRGRWASRSDLSRLAKNNGAFFDYPTNALAKVLGVTVESICIEVRETGIDLGGWMRKNLVLLHESAWEAYLRNSHVELAHTLVQGILRATAPGSVSAVNHNVLLDMIQRQNKKIVDLQSECQELRRIVSGWQAQFENLHQTLSELGQQNDQTNKPAIDLSAFRRHLNQGYAMLKRVEGEGR